MSEWDRVRLDEISEIIGGGTPSTKKDEYWHGDIPWITPRDLTGYQSKYISKGERSITLKGLENSSAKLLPENSVLMTSRAPIGYVAISNNVVTTNQGFKSLVPFPEKTTSLFLYYWVKGNIDFLGSLGTGTIFPEISGSVVKSIEIEIPPLTEQKAIASVLSSLDDKIDLLHRQNKTLESMAETLFRQWFVENDIEFIPNGLAELISIQNGYAFKSSKFCTTGLHRVIKIRNISKGVINLENTDRIDNFPENPSFIRFYVNSGDVLIAMTGAEIGKLGITPKKKNTSLLNQRVGKLVPKFKGADFLAYLLLKSDYGQDYIQNTATGSAQPNISAEGITGCSFPNVDLETILKYGESISFYKEKITSNLGSITLLQSLRDTLLPKLMSGEVRVQYEESQV